MRSGISFRVITDDESGMDMETFLLHFRAAERGLVRHLAKKDIDVDPRDIKVKAEHDRIKLMFSSEHAQYTGTEMVAVPEQQEKEND